MRKASGIYWPSKHTAAVRPAARRLKAEHGKCKKESKRNQIFITANSKRYSADTLKLCL
jgi:hypothetical protein